MYVSASAMLADCAGQKKTQFVVNAHKNMKLITAQQMKMTINASTAVRVITLPVATLVTE